MVQSNMTVRPREPWQTYEFAAKSRSYTSSSDIKTSHRNTKVFNYPFEYIYIPFIFIGRYDTYEEERLELSSYRLPVGVHIYL